MLKKLSSLFQMICVTCPGVLLRRMWLLSSGPLLLWRLAPSVSNWVCSAEPNLLGDQPQPVGLRMMGIFT